MPDYGNPSYWDERYAATDDIFDWYQDYSTLREPLSKFLGQGGNVEILIPGCGNSKLGADLYDAGFTNVTNIDTSLVVINKMNDRYSDRDEMEFTAMDATRMEYIPEDCFDYIIDKALMDTFLCNESNLRKVDEYLSEIHRVLKASGYFLVISHGVPPSRMEYFHEAMWTVEPIPLPKPRINVELGEEEVSPNHFLYVCRKNTSRLAH